MKPSRPSSSPRRRAIFAAEGYDVTLIAVGGSNESAIQVASGNAELGAASPGEAIVGIQSGKLDIRYFFDLYYANIWSVAVLPDSPIKTVAISRESASACNRWEAPVRRSARLSHRTPVLTPQTDISFLPIGVGAQALPRFNRSWSMRSIFWDAALAKFSFSGLNLRELPVSNVIRNLPDVGLLARNDHDREEPEDADRDRACGRERVRLFDGQSRRGGSDHLESLSGGASKNPDAAAALKEGVVVNQARLGIWNSPEIGDKHGVLQAKDWERLIQFFVDQKILPAPVPVDRVITNALIDEINHYDRSKAIVVTRKPISRARNSGRQSRTAGNHQFMATIFA